MLFFLNKFQVCTLFLCVHMLCMLCCTYMSHKIINKSDWYWQKWLCNWVTQLVRLQGFQGMLVTGVRFRFSKFPPSNMQSRCKAQLSTMEFFSTGERGLNMLEGFAQMMRGFGKCWHLSQLADKKYPRWSKWLRLWDFFWLPCKFNFCKSPAVKVKGHHHPVDLAQCFL